VVSSARWADYRAIGAGADKGWVTATIWELLVRMLLRPWRKCVDGLNDYEPLLRAQRTTAGQRG
jgi:hypothetical protein